MTSLKFSAELGSIIDYYDLYFDLMQFWMKKYPERIYHLDYDALTENPKIKIKNLISCIGLVWDKKCLAPHLNDRTVDTISRYQVRRQIYQGSSMEWKKFEPFLEGVFDILSEKKFSFPFEDPLVI